MLAVMGVVVIVVTEIPTQNIWQKTKFFSDGITGSSAASSNKASPFNFNLTRSAHAQSDNIDTETQIMAENVIFENSASSQIESDNVQDAFVEITMILPEVMIGRWEIANYDADNSHGPTGLIEIYNDGTFDLIEGSFAAIGMGSSGFCSHTEENQTYEVLNNELVRFTHYNDTTENSVIPLLIKLRQDEIVFMGSGGCGRVSGSRFSILSRVIE